MIIRKTILIQETIKVDGHGEPCNPVTRVAAVAVLQNPLAGRFIQDLSPSFDMGGELGEMLMTWAVSMLALGVCRT